MEGVFSSIGGQGLVLEVRVNMCYMLRYTVQQVQMHCAVDSDKSCYMHRHPVLQIEIL